MRTHMCTRTHAYARTHAHTRVHAYTHVRAHACTQAQTHTHARTHTHTRMHAHTHTHTHTSTSLTLLLSWVLLPSLLPCLWSFVTCLSAPSAFLFLSSCRLENKAKLLFTFSTETGYWSPHDLKHNDQQVNNNTAEPATSGSRGTQVHNATFQKDRCFLISNKMF